MRGYCPRVAGIQRLLFKPVFQRSRLNIRTGKVRAESCPSSWFYKRCQTRWIQLSQDKDWGHLHRVGLLEFPSVLTLLRTQNPTQVNSRTYENSFFKRTPSVTECTKGQWSRIVFPYCWTDFEKSPYHLSVLPTSENEIKLSMKMQISGDWLGFI